MDLVELTRRRRAWSPNTDLTARTSAGSPAGVEVPCALMYSTSSAGMPAPYRARLTGRAAPLPSSLGAVR